MDKKKALIAAVASFFIVMLGIIIFTFPPRSSEGRKIVVAVTIPPQAEFAEMIGREKVEVLVMVPQGASPHSYEPKPQQLAKLAQAQMYAKVGSGVEFELEWLDELLAVNSAIALVDCSQGISLIDDAGNREHGSADPHIWLSPRNAKIMAENIFRGLSEIDPENREYYFRNKEEYLRELDALDYEIASAFSGAGSRKILVYHNAWAYFARDYGLELIVVEEGGKEPTPAVIANVIAQARANSISVVFASPEFSTANAEAIAREIGGRVALITPLEKEYIKNMRSIADAFSHT